jgi:hypothetical protein
MLVCAAASCEKKPGSPRASPPAASTSAATPLPPTPAATVAQSLLRELDVLERHLGLAVIAATPPSRGGSSLSERDTQRRADSASRQLAFLNKTKPIADELVRAKTSLAAFIKSPGDGEWATAWRNLSTAHSGFTELTASAVWIDNVPDRESREVIARLKAVDAAMAQLRN